MANKEQPVEFDEASGLPVQTAKYLRERGATDETLRAMGESDEVGDAVLLAKLISNGNGEV